MIASEIYVPGAFYDFAVRFLADAIRSHAHDEAERRDRVHVGLKCAGIDMGETIFVAGTIRPTKRADLVDALMKLEPDVEGRFDDDDVRWVLSDHDIWPHRIRADQLSH